MQCGRADHPQRGETENFAQMNHAGDMDLGERPFVASLNLYRETDELRELLAAQFLSLTLGEQERADRLLHVAKFRDPFETGPAMHRVADLRISRYDQAHAID